MSAQRPILGADGPEDWGIGQGDDLDLAAAFALHDLAVAEPRRAVLAQKLETVRYHVDAPKQGQTALHGSSGSGRIYPMGRRSSYRLACPSLQILLPVSEGQAKPIWSRCMSIHFVFVRFFVDFPPSFPFDRLIHLSDDAIPAEYESMCREWSNRNHGDHATKFVAARTNGPIAWRNLSM